MTSSTQPFGTCIAGLPELSTAAKERTRRTAGEALGVRGTGQNVAKWVVAGVAYRAAEAVYELAACARLLICGAAAYGYAYLKRAGWE